MARRAWMGVAVALAAGCGRGEGASSRTLSGPEREVSGTVTRASGAEIAIRGANDRPVTLHLDASTPVTLDGRKASASDIHEGAQVRASYRTDPGGTPVAVRVDANSGTGSRTRSYGSTDAQRTLEPAPAAPAFNDAANGAHGGQGMSPADSHGPGSPGAEARQ